MGLPANQCPLSFQLASDSTVLHNIVLVIIELIGRARKFLVSIEKGAFIPLAQLDLQK
jgi:hypothetical protein